VDFEDDRDPTLRCINQVNVAVCRPRENAPLQRTRAVSGNLVRTVDERAAEGTRGNPKDSDSTGGLIPKREGCAVSVSSPDLRERIGCVQGLVPLIGIGYSIKPNAVPGTSPVLA
jgi:hypothetical protein